MQNYYKVLDLPRDASEQQIKQAYRTKALQFHPERQKQSKPSPVEYQQFREVAEAYEALSDGEYPAVTVKSTIDQQEARGEAGKDKQRK